MDVPRDLFTSPELYPVQIDFRRRSVIFARISRQDYEDFVFLEIDAVLRQIRQLCEIRVDDLLLAAANAPPVVKPVHYILHTAYCCSTLLARYFDLIPSCFVLKEPQLLAQFALASDRFSEGWNEGFELCVRLLSRTPDACELPVIKTNVPCNVLGERFLKHNRQATITFLMMPLRHFLLAVLKSGIRRRRVQYWVGKLIGDPLWCSQLGNIKARDLTDVEAAICFWLVNHSLCSQLSSGADRSRVLALDGERVADCPREALPAVMSICGQPLDNDRLEWLLNHPSARRHAKHPLRAYDASVRRQEIASWEDRWGGEADIGIEWAVTQGILTGMSLV